MMEEEITISLKRLADATLENLKELYARVAALEAEVKQLKGENK